MALKGDYGGFAKGSTRLLTPQVESLGFRPWYGGGLGREKAGWVTCRWWLIRNGGNNCFESGSARADSAPNAATRSRG